MRQIVVSVHREDGAWWADSASLPGFYATGATLDDLRVNVRAGVSFELDDAAHAIIEASFGGSAWVDGRSTGQAILSTVQESFRFSPQTRPAAAPKTNARLAFA